MSERLAELLERYVEHHERSGERLSLDELCPGDGELRSALEGHLRRYHDLERTLDFPSSSPAQAAAPPAELPSFEGFRTVERLGAGGMGEVYKLEDLRLGRIVAAKVLRSDNRVPYADFLREARSLALFEDPGIVRIHEYRDDPGVLVMEYVEGFELGRIAASLEMGQRARLLAEVCETIQRAHERGIQHRDLKPGNILVDAKLRPRIVDFGLAAGDPSSGHGVGTPGYLAPEQLDPERPIDERTDVYALGVVLYELICGESPCPGDALAAIAAIREGRPRLPKEIDPGVPEPLQAIALKAMEHDPGKRYASAREMAQDLRRFLAGRPVLARPTLYASALDEKVRPHLTELREWLDLKLIYPHEAERLREEYRRLDSREDDWIVESRRLTLSQIALYLGAFLLLCGGLFYFAVHRIFEGTSGLAEPFLVLGLPFAGLTAAALVLERRERRAVAVAFYLAGAAILPVLLILSLHELGLSPVTGDDFLDTVSNRVLQVATSLSCAWALWLALRTRTAALGTAFTALMVVLTLTVHADLGLETWLEEGRWDLLAFHSAPLAVLLAVLAAATDRTRRAWLATPLYLGTAGVFVAVLELLALDGRAFSYLGFTMVSLQDAEVADPLLLDTLAAMTLNGLLVYAVASTVERFGSELAKRAARLLFVLSPFLVLEPVSYLSYTDEYASFYLWLYLVLGLGITFLSHHRQRKSFYYAGLFNTGVALLLLANRYEWLDVPGFAASVVVAGLVALVAGVGWDHLERRRREHG